LCINLDKVVLLGKTILIVKLEVMRVLIDGNGGRSYTAYHFMVDAKVGS